MPLIENPVSQKLEEVFSSFGLTKKVSEIESKHELVQRSLDANGLSITDLAQELAVIVKDPSMPVKTRMHGIVTGFKLHQVMESKENESVQDNRVIFNLNGENVQLNAVLNPQRTKD